MFEKNKNKENEKVVETYIKIVEDAIIDLEEYYDLKIILKKVLDISKK